MKRKPMKIMPVMIQEDKLKKMWKGISPPTREDETTNGWYVAIFQEKKSLICTLGKLLRRFLLDKDGLANALELDRLKPHVGNGTALLSYDKSTERDLFVYPLHNIIADPIKVIPYKFLNLDVPGYQKLEKILQEVTNLDHQLIYNLTSIMEILLYLHASTE